MNTDFKLTFGGVVLFVFLAICCYLWYQWETEPYRKDYAKTQQLIQEWTSPLNTMETVQVLDDVEIQAVDALEQKSVSAVKSPAQTDTGIEDVKPPNASVAASQISEHARVSPYGLGPYPKIPEGWPSGYPFNNTTKNHEILARVKVKLFAETGKYCEGISFNQDTGLVYPIYSNTVYARWNTITSFNGTPIRYITGMSTTPEIGDQIRSNAKTRHEKTPEHLRFRRRPMIMAEDIPDGVDVSPFSKGFDPYKFLGISH